MILEIIIGILGLIVAILGYATFNLLQKNEKAEDIIVSQGEFINKMEEHISYSNKRLKQIDDKGIFYADDQIGFFFKEVQKIQEALNEFTLK